ncbi:glycosyltransferase family 39 protein [Candidatus Woesearchaeota archaeon]|nr:glycosyltransferase family 39 protein [Candidatus Woesearchaeota archaeon]
MKGVYIKLIIAFTIIFLLKAILSYFILAPSEFADGYIYSKIARGVFFSQELSVHGISIDHLPLYPILLSISYVFNDMNNVYIAMKVINAFISSLIIFPAFFLAKEFLSTKKSFLFSILISVLPANFAFSPYIMTENLFYPLFLTSIYFIYKSFQENKMKYDLLASLFIGLSFLTRALTFVLIIVVGALFIYKIIIRDYKLKEFLMKLVYYLIPFLLVVSPWIIRNLFLFNNELGIISNHYLTKSFALPRPAHILILFTLVWTILYFGFMMLSSGVIFPLMHLKAIKKFFEDKKLFLLLLISYISLGAVILVISRYNAGTAASNDILFRLYGRPLGRHLDVILPLIILLGVISTTFYNKIKENLFIPLIITTLSLLFSIRLVFFPLFPLNNLSLAWVGTLKYLIDFVFYGRQSTEIIFSMASFIIFIIIFLLIPIIIFILHKKDMLKINNVMKFFVVFFLLVSLLNYGLTYYNSNIWYNGEQMQLGLWFNDYNPEISNILIDERDCTRKISKDDQSSLCEPSKSSTIIGFWMNDNIIIGDVSNLKSKDFVITKHNLNLELVKESKSGIKIYKT